MATLLNPYLSFAGNARQAMEFYQSVFGGDVTSTTFAEGQMPHDPASADNIMHAQLDSPNGLVLMASDTAPGIAYTPGSSISISLSGGSGDEGEVRGYWDKLVDEGTVTMPLEQAPWGDTFGMCTDKFGTEWLVNIAGAAPSDA